MSLNPSLEGLSVGRKQTTVGFSEILDSYQRNSNWWTVFACFDLRDCVPTAKGISQRTGLELSEVEDALSGLSLLGYVKLENGRYVQVPGREFLHFDFEGRPMQEIVDRHALISQQVLNHLSPERKLAYDHRCFAANGKIIDELYKDLAAAFEKAFTKAQTSETNDRIFKMTYTAVDVLNSMPSSGSNS